MTDVELLKSVIKDSGVTITFIADKLGLTREGFYKKLNGESEFKVSEICKLQLVLHITDLERDRIFFTKECECNSQSTIKEV